MTELYVLQLHDGSLTAGHYTTEAVRDGDRWMNFNDDKVTAINGHDAAKNAHRAYMIAYELVSS